MRLLAAAALLAASCTTPPPTAAITWAGLDTLAGPLLATASRCPETSVLVLEGVSDSLGVLFVLPHDSSGTYLLDGAVVRGIVSRVLPSRIDSWRADSGVVDLQSTDDGLTASFDLWLPDARVHGQFADLAPRPDTMACAVGDSIVVE